MNILNIFIILGIVYIILNITDTSKSVISTKENNTNVENMNTNTNKITGSYKTDDIGLVDQVINDIVSWDSNDSNGNYNDKIKFNRINSNLINNKFHNDYRDVMTAINNIIPDKKQIFNLANIPLKYSQPEIAEVKNLVNDFVKVLNENIKHAVPSYRNPNSGWDEAIIDPTVKSGWDSVQESLGLNPSLWDKPAVKDNIELIAITDVDKYETEDEIKYSCDIVIQKKNVYDQMILKASFVQDKRPLHDENNFFITANVDMKIVVEDINILGYLSEDGTDAKLLFDKDMEKFYDYNQLEYNNLVDPKYIQKILMEKYRQRTEEMEQRNAMLDEEGQTFHRELPHIYDFSNIKGTQTIFDDMNYSKKFI